MDRSTKIKSAVGVAAAVAVAGVGATAIAAAGPWSPAEESQAVIDDAAKQLGVQPTELSDALKQALKNRVDDAVEAGRLTEEQGSALKERIDSGDSPLLFGGLGPHGPGHFGHFGHFGGLDGAATYLGLTEAELRSELSDGKTLAEIAKAEGKSVDGLVQALVKAATEKLEQAVEDGRLTKAQADDVRADLEERITELVNGELRSGRGFGLHRGFDGFERGDHPFLGPRA